MLFKKGQYQVEVANDGAIHVRQGDWLSKYSFAMYGDYAHVNEFGRKDASGKVTPVADINKIHAGETLYHIPTHKKSLTPAPAPTPTPPTPPPKAPPPAHSAPAEDKLLTSDSGNNYDLLLYSTAAGDYKLVVFMKLQFFFVDDHGLKWTEQEKKKTVENWVHAVSSKWGNREIKTTPAGKKVTIEFRFKTQIGGWMWDHWEITVNKIPAGAFETSSVTDGFVNNVDLDSEDLTLTSKGHGQSQRGVVHEFGHMLGIDDEYLDGSAHKTDYKSIMNRGEDVLRRHDAQFVQWLDNEVKKGTIQ